LRYPCTVRLQRVELLDLKMLPGHARLELSNCRLPSLAFSFRRGYLLFDQIKREVVITVYEYQRTADGDHRTPQSGDIVKGDMTAAIGDGIMSVLWYALSQDFDRREKRMRD
jgi:hypothetical protein